jgi:predicted alpha/beta hydrolase family esterase
MNRYLIIPGLGNSGPEHWQTFFEQSGNNFLRIQQKEWDAPDCNDWISTFDKMVSRFDPAHTILIGHSLGCATIAHWARKYNKMVKAAMLVAPSDVEAPIYAFPATGFAPMPLQKLPFKTLVVASTNDPWVSLERANFFADHWGSELINIGDAGHINAASGHGPWMEGLHILNSLG